MLMLILFILGLALGSFVNALVWRIHEQNKSNKRRTTGVDDLSITKGRSMCPHCNHRLSAKDLVPVASWIMLRGKCRYCSKTIGWQYPAVELATAFLFIMSYVYWPLGFEAAGIVSLITWLIALVGFVALFVYDVRWMLLPNRIVFPLMLIAGVGVLARALFLSDWTIILDGSLSLVIGGGIFYALFQISNGKWIGGGDVKLGFVIGLVLGKPELSFLMLFIASILGTFVALPGMLRGKMTRTSRLPFGPFLIVATILVELFGASLIKWYQNQLLY